MRTPWETALLAAVACARPPSLTHGIGSEVAEAVYACENLEGGARDWCAVTALPRDQGSGADVEALCGRLRDEAARDRCLVLAVAHRPSPASASACAQIRDAPARALCWTDAADTLAASDLELAIQACDRAEAGKERCVATLLQARRGAWTLLPPTQTLRELQTMLQIEPRLAYDSGFGAQVGALCAGNATYTRAAWPCDAFPPGSGKMACELGSVG